MWSTPCYKNSNHDGQLFIYLMVYALIVCCVCALIIVVVVWLCSVSVIQCEMWFLVCAALRCTSVIVICLCLAICIMLCVTLFHIVYVVRSLTGLRFVSSVSSVFIVSQPATFRLCFVCRVLCCDCTVLFSEFCRLVRCGLRSHTLNDFFSSCTCFFLYLWQI